MTLCGVVVLVSIIILSFVWFRLRLHASLSLSLSVIETRTYGHICMHHKVQQCTTHKPQNRVRKNIHAYDNAVRVRNDMGVCDGAVCLCIPYNICANRSITAHLHEIYAVTHVWRAKHKLDTKQQTCGTFYGGFAAQMTFECICVHLNKRVVDVCSSTFTPRMRTFQTFARARVACPLPLLISTANKPIPLNLRDNFSRIQRARVPQISANRQTTNTRPHCTVHTKACVFYSMRFASTNQPASQPAVTLLCLVSGAPASPHVVANNLIKLCPWMNRVLLHALQYCKNVLSTTVHHKPFRITQFLCTFWNSFSLLDAS